jgi:hypothetical protein
VHIRCGDIVENPRYASRFLNQAVLGRVLDNLPPCILPHPYVSVFSAGAEAAEMEAVLAVARERGVGAALQWLGEPAGGVW